MFRRAILTVGRFLVACLLAVCLVSPSRGQDRVAKSQEIAVADSPLTPDQLADIYEERSVKISTATDKTINTGEPIEVRYRLLKPANPRPGTRYPLVLFLHGAGERGSDNLAQLKYLPAWMAEPAARANFACYVVAPQCRNEEKWVDVDWSDPNSAPQKPKPTPDMVGAIAALLETLRTEPVDPQRIYLTGLSMGGYGSWDLAARMPERFAAVLPVCGGADEATADKIKDLPIWCFHGDADTAVAVERSRRMIEAIRAAGGAPKYSELAGVGHDSWTPAYRDPEVLEWLFAQKKPAAPKAK